MPTIRVRDVPEAVYETLQRRARRDGQSIQAYVRERIVELAETPSSAETPELIERARPVGRFRRVRSADRGRCRRRPSVNTIVPDASALIAATTRIDGESVALRRRMAAADCHAPHLIDAELGSVLRRMTLRGQLAPELATTLLLASPRLVTHRHDHRGSLAAAAWALRDT